MAIPLVFASALSHIGAIGTGLIIGSSTALVRGTATKTYQHDGSQHRIF